jgi:uncharacterized protein RhaS with RHS repeats
VVFLTVLTVLIYLVINRELVYTSDLTGSQAKMLQQKNVTYSASTRVYADRIELPLMLFYTNGPFEITDYTPLVETITQSDKNGNQLVFITKESRFKKIQKEFPTVKYVSSSNEWYLGVLPAK